MESNFKRKLIAGLFVPVLGLSVGAALAQSSGGSTGSAGSGTSAAGSTSGASTMGAGTQAGAQGSGSAAWSAQTFDKLDANKDGMLTREEAQADPALRDAWSRLDAKSAGRVSREDFDKFRTTMGAQPGSTVTPK